MRRGYRLALLTIIATSGIVPSISYSKTLGSKSSISSKISVNIKTKLKVSQNSNSETNNQLDIIQKNDFCVDDSSKIGYKVFSNHQNNNSYSIEWRDGNSISRLEDNKEFIVANNEQVKGNCPNSSSHASLELIANDRQILPEENKIITINFSPV